MKKRILSFLIVIIMLFALVPTAFAASDKATTAANELYYLGLLNGEGRNSVGKPILNLDNNLTRQEAVTMLVRLLGKEDEALAGTWQIPFTDVADWAKPYVGYAYANKLANGTSGTTFSGDAPVNATQYITLVLRALGYDSKTDFQWNKAWELSDKIGLTSGNYSTNSAFTRGDLALISYHALFQNINATDENLLKTLTPEITVDNLQGIWFEEHGHSDEIIFTGNRFAMVHSTAKYPLTEKNIANANVYFHYCEGTFRVENNEVILTVEHTTDADNGKLVSDGNVLGGYKVGEEFSFSRLAYKNNSGGKDSLFTGNALYFYWPCEYKLGVLSSDAYRKIQASRLVTCVQGVIKNPSTFGSNNSPTTTPATSTDYNYLAGNDFRRIKRNYPSATARYAYVTVFKNKSGQLCVLTDVYYKIRSNFHDVTLHNISTGQQITDPVNYYEKLINRSYGQSKLNYLDLQLEVLECLIQQTSKGNYIDAKSLEP
ncbi:MAG: S-layer homology domain-containing protein [Oscillospiraceae bacterium]|nr:S-layer homology domain-containing protein [Oscillospiraceae bacterium]